MLRLQYRFNATLQVLASTSKTTCNRVAHRNSLRSGGIASKAIV